MVYGILFEVRLAADTTLIHSRPMRMKRQTLHILRSDGTKMKILVYSPQGEEMSQPAPGVLWIHGGGAKVEHRGHLACHAEAAVGAAFAAAQKKYFKENNI